MPRPAVLLTALAIAIASAAPHGVTQAMEMLKAPEVLEARAAQRRTTPKRAAPAKPAPPTTTIITPKMVCPAPLGTGVKSGRAFCDVLTGQSPADGIIVDLPAHRGPVTIRFDLHNRHIYSEDQAKAGGAFARYTSRIGVLTMDNTLVSRATIQSEVRGAGDLFDRIPSGAGTTRLKAVAPTGLEAVRIVIPEQETRVSILGDRLTVDRPDGTTTYSSPGRPIAIVSNVTIEYVPAPAAPARRTPTSKR